MKPINRIFLFLLFYKAFHTPSVMHRRINPISCIPSKRTKFISISKMYNVTTSDIIHLNPVVTRKFMPDKPLKFPKGKESQKGETFHTIQAGETLYKLTTMYNISAKDICEANPGLSAENFRIGQVILIPQKEKEQVVTAQKPTEQSNIQGPVVPRCKEMHKVKRKETIFSVSREYGISEEELIAANPELKKGMKKDNFYVSPTRWQQPRNPPRKKIHMLSLQVTANFSAKVRRLPRRCRPLKPH